jgi:hypothetical protein
VAFGFGLGAIAVAPYYYAPPYYPPVYYTPPQTYYQPPPRGYSQAQGGGGQSCYAGAYVCPMDRPVTTGASCYCPGNNGQKVPGSPDTTAVCACEAKPSVTTDEISARLPAG